ncbi:Tn3 family transposase [Xanthomonas populi]|uniref:transposase n=1 Tax=Xanthomonas populi TaxID=53414 RepID=UPI001FCA0175
MRALVSTRSGCNQLIYLGKTWGNLRVSMLSLHLIQNCMVYINTLMIQKVLAQPHWQGKLTPRDYAALTLLIWEHVNPYGRFDLDMNTRLDLP